MLVEGTCMGGLGNALADGRYTYANERISVRATIQENQYDQYISTVITITLRIIGAIWRRASGCTWYGCERANQQQCSNSSYQALYDECEGFFL
jgi:uncharacterized Fe-S cluster-containing MiaB family protein